MEQEAAPAGVARSHALGRPRGSARWPLRAGCEELADGGRDRPRKRGPGPSWRLTGDAGETAVERRAAWRPHWTPPSQDADRRLVRRPALHLPSGFRT